jgi:hypothetical protein
MHRARRGEHEVSVACFSSATSVRTSLSPVAMTAVMLAMLTGCRTDEGRLLRAVEIVPLPDSAITLAVDGEGRQWLGRPGAMRVRDAAGSARDLRLPGAAAPRVVGWVDGTAYLQQGDALLVMPGRADSITAAREVFGRNPLLCDVRGRAVLQGARSGAVLAHDPATLEPLWAWAALGAATTALAASPEGDRVYQALDDDDRDPQVLTRDLQTGRDLGRMELDFPLEEMVAADDGTLYGVGREGRRAVIVALRPGGGELELVWRMPLPVDDAAARVRIVVSGAWVAVWGRGPREGLRILDSEEGDILARDRTEPLDVAFGPDGQLWALYPRELRRLE